MTPRVEPATGVARIADWPYLLLALTSLFWAGNFIVGRAVNGMVPPVALAFWRWTGGFLIILPLAWPHLRRDLPIALKHWKIVLVLSAVGVASFNTLVYLGLRETTAINGLLIQSVMPVAIVLTSYALFRDPVGPAQMLGLALSLAGIVAIVARGDLATLATLDLNRGDLLIFLAIVSYAFYTALLRRKPPVHPYSMVAITFGCGAAMLLPLHAIEWSMGSVPRLDTVTLAAMGYVALFPSVLAYLCYNRGVELIGANRAGQFVHLMPVFGTLMAVTLLNESFRLFHAAGIALIVAGILLANRKAG